MGEDFNIDSQNKRFQPTVEWMKKRYDEMNSWLFNGELGDCKFAIFTSGRGSHGRVLGWHKITGRPRIDLQTRRMYQDGLFGHIYVTSKNFVELCKPVIELNGNYYGTEKSFLATLVHEMCHYYTYMHGYAPVQGHGPEFRAIGESVSARSRGLFTIQRLASAEQMADMELNDEMKAYKERRLANKKAAAWVVVRFMTNGEVQLTITANRDVIEEICDHEKGVEKIFKSRDPELIDFLFNHGFKRSMRTWRYWEISDVSWLDIFDRSEGDTIYVSPTARPKEEEKETAPTKKEKRIFSMNTNDGKYEVEFESEDELFDKLQKDFPYCSTDAIARLMANKSNYRSVDEAVEPEGVITEKTELGVGDTPIKRDSEDSIEITPDMNLGLYSPIELYSANS